MELLLDRIDRAERLFGNLKRQTTPTWPLYDLQGPSIIIDVPNLDSIKVKLNAFGSPVDQMKCSLCNDASGLPGSELVSDTQTVSSAILYSFAMGGFIFSLGIPYWIVLERTGSLDNSNAYNIHGSAPAGAPANYQWYDGTWHTSSGNWINETTIFGGGSGGWAGGVDNGVTGGIGTTSVQKIAETFTIT